MVFQPGNAVMTTRCVDIRVTENVTVPVSSGLLTDTRLYFDAGPAGAGTDRGDGRRTHRDIPGDGLPCSGTFEGSRRPGICRKDPRHQRLGGSKHHRGP